MRFFENLGGKRRVQRVPRAVRDQVADDRIADERQVANRIEDLVADELVLEAQRVVQHARLTQHDRILQRAAQRQAILPQHFYVLEERERAGRGNYLDE